MKEIDPRHVKGYADRPWTAVESAKQEHWARAFAEHGPEATFAASQSLWLHMRALRPEWPTDEERADDLERHLALKRALERAGNVFRAIPRC
jgi:hypothetical protein